MVEPYIQVLLSKNMSLANKERLIDTLNPQRIDLYGR